MNNRLAALLAKPRPKPAAPLLPRLRARLNDERRFEYVLMGCSLLMFAALVDINQAAVGLGWVSP